MFGLSKLLPLALLPFLSVYAALAFTVSGPVVLYYYPFLKRNIKLALKHPEKVHSSSFPLLFALSWSTNTFTKTFQATQSPPPS